MRYLSTIALVAAALAVAALPGSDSIARPLLFRGGAPHGGGEPPPASSLCAPGLTGPVCAQFQNGQTFVTWADMATGAAGDNWRYSMYRSTAPITSASYASATLIASLILNNSGQLSGGNPSAGSNFSQGTRQNASVPMVMLSDLGTPLSYGTGLQVYTALGSASAYYAIVAVPSSGGLPTGVAPTYIGSVGPVAEAVGSVTPIKFADSFNRGQSYGKITSPAGKALVFKPHASSRGGGPAGPGSTAVAGDYWIWWLTAAREGWQDGRQTTWGVLQTSDTGWLEAYNRDTIWNPLGTGGLEANHLGFGFTPNPLVGPPNRLYETNQLGIQRGLKWTIAHYGADPNAIYWRGTSLGGMAATTVGMRMKDPQAAAIFATDAQWRVDWRWGNNVCGFVWSAAMPFKATLGTAPYVCGPNNGPTTSSLVMASDPSMTFLTWGNMPAFIASDPGTDLPAAFWFNAKDDGPFSQQLQADAAFKGAHRGYAWVWNTSHHDQSATNIVDCTSGAAVAASCHQQSWYKLNKPYLAFDGSSIDHDPGTGHRNAFGLLDGDVTGGINLGFNWKVSADTPGAFNFTVGNTWMTQPKTPEPTTRTTAAVTKTDTVIHLQDPSVFINANSAGSFRNDFYLIDSTEIVRAPSTTAVQGNDLTQLQRGQLGTAALEHGSGATVRQYMRQPSGPPNGAVSTMTVNITPRRMQNFIRANGVSVSCKVTPFGGNPSTVNMTVTNKIFTLPAVRINSSGVTTVNCSRLQQRPTAADGRA